MIKSANLAQCAHFYCYLLAISYAKVIELSENTMTKRAFFGELYFNIRLSALDVAITRIVRAIYAYTPEWPYWSKPRTRSALQPGLDLTVHILAHRVPRGGLGAIPLTQQQWVPIDSLLVRGIMKPGMYMNLKKLIDREVRLQDDANRRAAGAPPLSCPHDYL